MPRWMQRSLLSGKTATGENGKSIMAAGRRCVRAVNYFCRESDPRVMTCTHSEAH